MPGRKLFWSSLSKLTGASMFAAEASDTADFQTQNRTAAVHADRWMTGPDNVKLYSRDYSGADGDAKLPVICLHGLTRNSADFEDVAPYIAAGGRRVIVPDVRGRGLSDYDPMAVNYNPLTYVGDVMALCDRLGISQAHFIGTSMGGIMIMLLATLRPGLIKSAVLNDVGPFLSIKALQRIGNYGDSHPGAFKDWMQAADYARKLNEVAFPHYTPGDWLSFAHRLCRADENGEIHLAYDPAIFNAFKSPTITPAAFDMSVPFRALAAGCKILVIRGEISDLLESSGVDSMQSIASDMVRVEIEGVGHAPMLTEPAARAAVVAHLDKQP